MWRAIGASVIGTSHEKAQTPCQDSCAYYSCFLGSERVMVIAIADGAGSAAASEIGSSEAVQCILRQIANSGLTLFEISEGTVAKWMKVAREHLESVALARGVTSRDLACTLMFAILGEFASIFAQVGDGAWVARGHNGAAIATWPSGGEYANQTTFITSPNWREVLQFRVIVEPLRSVGGFSDGLQSVALHFGSRSVHAPFFEAKWDALHAADDETSLHAPLVAFLGSPALAERTDDDKTLVLACRQEVKLLAGPAA